jgi:hypothetical protein
MMYEGTVNVTAGQRSRMITSFAMHEKDRNPASPERLLSGSDTRAAYDKIGSVCDGPLSDTVSGIRTLAECWA